MPTDIADLTPSVRQPDIDFTMDDLLEIWRLLALHGTDETLPLCEKIRRHLESRNA